MAGPSHATARIGAAAGKLLSRHIEHGRKIAMIHTCPAFQGMLPLRSATRNDRQATSIWGGRLARRGFTLIEILVALVVTLIMMGTVVSLFGVIADSVAGSRAIVEMSDRLRACRNRLQADLQGATATMTPSLRPENDAGYLEVLEGLRNDGEPNFTGPGADLFGDVDDAISLTVRSRGEPFIGKDGAAPPNVVESQVAEVTYFLAHAVDASGAELEPIINAADAPPKLWWQGTAPAAPTRLFTLFRHVRLVLPGTQNPSTSIAAQLTPPITAWTLGDLTKPENRFSHTAIGAGGTFPFRFTMPAAATLSSDDIVMTNVLAFDVQVWDPGGPVFIDTTSNVAIEPKDSGFRGAAGGTVAAFGAYCDLGYANVMSYTPPSPPQPQPLFGGAPNPKCGSNARPFCWDTWSMHYENDGVAQKGTMTNSTGAILDAGTNGLDDTDSATGAANGVVDDEKERDAMPPYKDPLRGIRIMVRAYEPSSQQIREITVIQDFHAE